MMKASKDRFISFVKNGPIDIQLQKYMLVGGVNTLFCGAIIFGLLHLVGVNYVAAYTTGYIIGLITSFLLNKHFTFKSDQHWLPEGVKFFIGAAISYMASTVMLIISAEYLHLSHDIAVVLGMVTYTAVNYILNKKMVFRQPGLVKDL